MAYMQNEVPLLYCGGPHFACMLRGDSFWRGFWLNLIQEGPERGQGGLSEGPTFQTLTLAGSRAKRPHTGQGSTISRCSALNGGPLPRGEGS